MCAGGRRDGDRYCESRVLPEGHPARALRDRGAPAAVSGRALAGLHDGAGCQPGTGRSSLRDRRHGGAAVTAPIAPDAAPVRQLAAALPLVLNDERVAPAPPILAAPLGVSVPAVRLRG